MTEPEWKPTRGKALREQLVAAREAGRRAEETEPRAVSARYDVDSRRIVIELRNGCAFAFPAEMGQGLRGASSEQLADIEVTPDGYALVWESLDMGLAVPPLLEGRFGNDAWMSQWGRIGGSARTEAKAAAARANGRKGGRPRKQPDAAAEETRKKAS